jgi:hypothetical protein
MPSLRNIAKVLTLELSKLDTGGKKKTDTIYDAGKTILNQHSSKVSVDLAISIVNNNQLTYNKFPIL